MIPVTPSEYVSAYSQAEYVVFGEPEIILKVGEPNAALDELMAADDARTAAYITPANPRGEVWTPEENGAALESFHDSLRETKYTCYPGEGRDPEGDWIAEPSLLVVGIPREEAEELGRKLEQNAIVFAEMGKAPFLVFLR